MTHAANATTNGLLPTLKERLTTAVLPAGQRMAYWLDAVCALYCRLNCDPWDDQPLAGEIEFSQVGEVQLTRVVSNSRRVWRADGVGAAPASDHYLALVLREGRAMLHQGGRMAQLVPGDVVLHACDQPYEIRFDVPQHEVHVLRLDKAQMAQHVHNLDDLTATTIARDTVAARLLANTVATLHHEGAQVHPSSAAELSDAMLHIVAAGVRALPRANVRKASNLAAYHLARIDRHLRAHLRDPDLSVGSIAAALQLSPDYVCRLYQGEPASLSRRIWQLRLEACRRELSDPRCTARSVSDIAFSWGFNDAAHFSRCFRRHHGMAPRDWRLQQLQAVQPPRLPPS